MMQRDKRLQLQQAPNLHLQQELVELQVAVIEELLRLT
jgi:hypothetical protein